MNDRIERLEREPWRVRVHIPTTPCSYHAMPYEVTVQRDKTRVALQPVFFFEPDPRDPSKEVPFIFATNLGTVTPELAMFLAAHYRDDLVRLLVE